ncbi:MULTISPECIES: MFS transporter [Brevibacterium]|uniref:MFS transporter n=1 Tax=Brevibacterium salitolerans TaxID=1403566 RepID=A0ABN2WRX9_9MICO|nr:MFS transporter [Brevibacterium sp.]
MLSKYSEIFGLPGALRFSLAGLVARLPIAVLGIGIVLFIQGETGSYELAGLVTSCYMVVQALTTPVIARLVDVFGQSRVMVPVVCVHMLSLLLMLLSVYMGWWFGWVFVFAGLTGASVGSLGSLVRARWNAIVENSRQLDTAFSWEAVADEFLFVTGPVLVTALATAWFSPAGVILSGCATLAGSLLFYPQKATEPTPRGRKAGGGGRVLSHPGILLAVFCQVFLGILFGAVDVTAVGFGDEQDAKAFAGIALSAFAAGSLLAGTVYGAMDWKIPVRRRFAYMLTLLSVGTWVLLLLATDMVAFSVLLFVVGGAIAPSLIAVSSVIQALAPPQRLTESLAWISTALGFGVAIGSALSGSVIDRLGAHEALWIIAVCATLACLLSFAGQRLMDPERVPGSRRRPRRETVDTSSIPVVAED